MYNFKLIQYNIRGLNNNYTDIDILSHKYNPDIFCLQETHIKTNSFIRKSNKYEILNNWNTKATQGVAFLIKNYIKYKTINLQTNLQAIAIEFHCPTKINICNIYIHPNDNTTVQELEHLILQIPPPRIIVGDFNAHNKLWGSLKTNNRGKIIETLVLNNNIINLNRKVPTYYHPSSGTATNIDLAFCSPDLTLQLNWDTLDQLQSDHLPIKISTAEKTNTQNITNPINYKKLDWKTFNNILSEKTIPDIDSQNVNDRINSLTEIITDTLLKSHTPHSNSPRKLVPWWTKEINRLHNEKTKRLKKFNRHPTTVNREEFNTIKNQFRAEIKIEKQKHWEKFIEETNTSNPKIFWKNIKKFKGLRNNCSINSLKLNGTIIFDAQTISDTLANTFVGSQKDSDKRKKNNLLKPVKNLHTIESETKYTINNPITHIEYLQALQHTKNDSAPGLDKINYQAIKNMPINYQQYLTDIYNEILQTGRYPSRWKTAKIIPILKKDKDSQEPNSYRPISLLSCLSKLLEKILARRITYWLTHENLLSKNQYGFKQGLSTIDALTRFHIDITTELSNKNHVDAIALDINKAFDCCWTESIISQLKKWGLNGNILNIISNFLEKRKFKILTQDLKSKTFNTIAGIPQGSPLSALLFIIAINNLSDTIGSVPHINHILFADDIIIYCAYKKKRSNNIQKTLNKITLWSKKYGFNIAPTKSQQIHFCKFKDCTRKVYKINDLPIESQDNIKYLGVIFDQKLNFMPHIEYIKNKNIQNLNILKILGNPNTGIKADLLIKISNAIIRSSLEYGSQIYSSASKTNLKKINPPYNAAIRISLGAMSTSPIEKIHKIAGTMTMSDRIDLQNCKYLIKVMYNQNHPNHKSLITHTQHINKKLTGLQKSFFNNVSQYANFINQAENYYDQPINPPWTKTQQTNTQLNEKIKKHNQPELQKQATLELLSKYVEYKKIYTDGSKSACATGFGVFSKDLSLEISTKINNISSIFTAEAKAIAKALEYIEINKLENQKIAVLSDSLSVISAIGNHYNKIHIINSIKSYLQYQPHTILIWIPSHVGIEGNERADALAKKALTDPNNTDIYIEDSDLTKVLTDKFKNPNQLVKNLSRKEETLLHNVYIGHHALTHSYLVNRMPQRGCNECQVALDMQHLLLDCENDKKRKLRFNFNINYSTYEEFIRNAKKHILYINLVFNS